MSVAEYGRNMLVRRHYKRPTISFGRTASAGFIWRFFKIGLTLLYLSRNSLWEALKHAS